MADILEDGSGKGFKAKIDSELRLHTRSTSIFEERQVGANGKAWSLFVDVTPVGAGDYFFYIKNNGTKALHITDVRISTTAATQILIEQVSGTPTFTAGAVIAPTSRNIGRSDIPDATIKSDTDTTGLNSEGVIFVMELPVADTLYHLKTTSNIIISQGSSLAIQRVAATGAITAIISLMEIDPNV